MSNKIKTVCSRVMKLSTVFALAFLAVTKNAYAEIVYQAQNATTTELFGAFLYDLTIVFVAVIGGVIGLAVLTVGIGYAWRKLKSKVFGKGF